ncbi:MAG: LysR family transcriptional regulator [Rhodobacterales bacterium]|nr:MAG: LysR family transcriptional regulator [Rhodobacterales bacterium]
MDFDWDDLRVFLAVARGESLSQAGRLLKMDPATVGRRISRLEHRLGAALFARSVQGYVLNNEGERLLVHAMRAESAMSQAGEELQGVAGQLSGTVRIGAPDGSANYLLPQVCAEICDQNPGLEVQIVAQPRVFNLSKREADMAVTLSPPTAGRLMAQRIGDYKLHLAATEAYLNSHPPIRHPQDLKGHRIIGYIPDMIFDKEVDYLGQIGVEHVTLGSNSVAVQANWVRHGAGLAIVHDFCMPTLPGIRRVLADQISLTRTFYLVRHLDDQRVDRLNRFADSLVQGMRDEITRLENQARAL